MNASSKICIFLVILLFSLFVFANELNSEGLQDRQAYTVNGKISGIKSLKKIRAIVLAYRVDRDRKGNIIDLQLEGPRFQKEINETGEFTFLLSGKKEYQIRLIAEGYKAPLYSMKKKSISRGQAISISIKAQKAKTIFMVGIFRDKFGNNRLPGVVATLIDLETKVQYKGITNAKGECFFNITSKGNYSMMGYKQKYFFSEPDTFTIERVETASLFREIKLEKVKKGQITTAKGHFEVNQSRITQEGAKNLDKLFELIYQNPGVRFELSCHLDSRGEDGYNLVLSQKRAEAAVQYLVSRGIAASLLIPKGYGETKLLNGCANGVKCGAKMHEENRRIELKVIGFME